MTNKDRLVLPRTVKYIHFKTDNQSVGCHLTRVLRGFAFLSKVAIIMSIICLMKVKAL